jgi:hypothetical protein
MSGVGLTRQRALGVSFYGDDCARQIGLAMTLENLLHQRDPSCGWYVRKANDSGMRRARKVDERPEVRVYRHQNASFFGRQSQQGGVARVGRWLPRLPHVMTFLAQPFCETSPGATVDEELHP